ncbi:phage major capsid protein [Alteriqipengyuania flavescens]|uniref:phage major capsid protein n=1 Tax=Alteriqipengyuania flavescens TaxID=3053610 RepID=UPI0025B353D5|nr:phage major capsid protein [Alteriqipengyuania flavescens]WJY17498.1 phage major capsid protein [Alteriqipengyuania flavescens]WJY23441.1 phage major capsid protein [Alteriqipengyuania flavescens]
MKTAELLEQRAALVDRMNAAHDKDDNAAFEAAETELRSLDAKLDRQRKIDAADRTETGTPLTTRDGDEFAELRNQSLIETLRFGAGMAVKDRAKIEREQAMLAERAGGPAKGVYVATELFEKRAAMTTATASAVAPESFRPDLFVSALTNTAIVSRLGATTLTGLTGDVVIPREIGSPNVGWVNEDEALPTDGATFDSLTLTPHHVGVITELSRQLLLQSSPQVEGLVRNMLSRNVALEIDRAAIAGSGTGAEPRGLINDPNVPTVPFTTDLFTTTADMIAAADVANIGDSRAFLSTNGVRATAMKLRDGDGHPITIAETFHGEQAYFTNQAPDNLGAGTDENGLVYGDWSDLLIGIWSQLDILVNPYAETAYSKGNILVRAMASVDFGVRRPASFVSATGVAG